MVSMQTAKQLDKQLQDELDVIGKKLGWSLKLKGGKVGVTVVFKLEATTIGADGTLAESAEAVQFKRYANLLGLSPDDLGKVFQVANGNRYKISGAKMSARKFPILAVNIVDGKTYKFSQTVVKACLDK